MLTVLENKLILSQDTIELLNASPGDRIAINYVQKSSKITFPIIAKSIYFTDHEAGNKLTKSNTISYRGQQRSILLEYGKEFQLEDYKDNIYKLVPITDESIEFDVEKLLN